MYKCEVIGEGPEFLTSDKHAPMDVVSKYECQDEGRKPHACVCMCGSESEGEEGEREGELAK